MPREEAGRAYDTLLEAEANRAKASASAAVAASANRVQTPAVLEGPANQLTLISGAITPKVSGKFRVTASMSVVDSIVDEQINFTLVRDPTSPTGPAGGVDVGPTENVSAAHVSGEAQCSITWVDSVALGSGPHKWGLNAIGTAGNLTLGANNGTILVEELPG